MESDREQNQRLSNIFFGRLNEQVLKPNAEEIGRIIFRGDIAVIVFEPFELALTLARRLGWDGEQPVFRMSNTSRKKLAHI